MTNQFKRVAIHDSKWIIEVVKFDQNAEELTLAYPRWFIMLLVGQDPHGFKIEFHSPSGRWFLRSPLTPDYVLEKGMWVCRNQEGNTWVSDNYTLERAYRLWDEEHDNHATHI